MESLWRATGPPIPTDDPEMHDSTFDVVVVGAGLTGIMSGLLLSRAGMRVLICEARSVGAVTTGGTTGKLSLLQGTTLSDIRKHAGDDVLRAYVEANREGQAWITRDFGSVPRIAQQEMAFTLASTDEGAERLRQEFEACQVAGIPVRMVGSTPLPVQVTAALQLDDQWQLHSMELLAALVTEFRRRGGMIVENCRVTEVATDAESVLLETPLGDIRAGHVVLATGTPILDRGLFFARLAPSRTFAATYELSSRPVPRGMHLQVDDGNHSVRPVRLPDGSDVLLVAGGAHATGRADDTVQSLHDLDAWVQQHFGPATRTSWWAAQDYQDITRVPFMGALRSTHQRVFAATGFNKWGLTTGVAAALAITSQILDGHVEWAATLLDHHFSLADAGSALSLGAATGQNLLKGWVGAEISQNSDEDLLEGEGKVGSVGLRPVARSKIDGVICEVSAVCPHMGGIVNWNAAERTWDCPLHGSRYRADGELLEGPAVRGLKPVREEHS